MSYVKDTVILSAKHDSGADGATWKTLVISCENGSFHPGQFLMVSAAGKAGSGWPSPLTIQRCVSRGFEVTVHPHSPLYGLREGDLVAVWGPNGKEPTIAERFSVLCDAKGLILAGPVIREWKSRCAEVFVSGIYRPDAASDFLDGTEVKPAEELYANSADRGDEAFLVALPLAELAQRMKAAPEIFAESVVFTGAKIGCGIGACRGCFIHSGPQSTGTAVCQEGPFLRAAAVDYTKDQNFLGHYI